MGRPQRSPCPNCPDPAIGRKEPSLTDAAIRTNVSYLTLAKTETKSNGVLPRVCVTRIFNGFGGQASRAKTTVSDPHVLSGRNRRARGLSGSFSLGSIVTSARPL